MSLQRRAFFCIHRPFVEAAGKRLERASEDFPPDTSHDAVVAALRLKFGHPPQTQDEKCPNSFVDGICSRVIETEHEKARIESPKHLGTSGLFDGITWAELQTDPTKAKKQKKIV